LAILNLSKVAKFCLQILTCSLNQAIVTV
jgi:hypothetical protein